MTWERDCLSAVASLAPRISSALNEINLTKTFVVSVTSSIQLFKWKKNLSRTVLNLCNVWNGRDIFLETFASEEYITYEGIASTPCHRKILPKLQFNWFDKIPLHFIVKSKVIYFKDSDCLHNRKGTITFK